MPARREVVEVIVIALIVATVALVSLGTAFVAVVVGVHLAERRKSLPGSSRGFADAFARRVLRAEARQCSRRVREAK